MARLYFRHDAPGTATFRIFHFAAAGFRAKKNDRWNIVTEVGPPSHYLALAYFKAEIARRTRAKIFRRAEDFFTRISVKWR